MKRTRIIPVVVIAWLLLGLALFLAKDRFFTWEPRPLPPGAAESLPSLPRRLYVPRLGIDALVIPVGKDAEGKMESPAHPDDVGWYSYGARPGDPGRAVFAGRYNTELGTKAVFADLQDLQEGDLIEIEDSDGEILDFRVEHTQSFPVEEAPRAAIFGPSDLRELRLITCAGAWNEDSYTERFVVFAQLVE